MKKIIILLTVLILVVIVGSKNEVMALESQKHIVELTDYSINSFYAFELDDAADIYEEDGNQFIKLTNKGKDYSSFYFESVDFLDRNASYRIEMDLRYDDNFDTTNLFVGLLTSNLSQPRAWTIATSKSDLDSKVLAEEQNGYKHLVFDFSIEDYYSYFYKFIKIGFKNEENEHIFLDVDNIKIYRGTEMSFTEENIDKSIPGDFENFVKDDNYLGDIEWVFEDDNTCLKITGEKEINILEKVLAKETNQVRNYSLEFSVKKSEKFSGSLSFEIPNAKVNETNIDISNISTTWSTVTIDFTPKVNTNLTSELILYFKTNNPSVDNFIMIDNFKIIRKSNQENIDALYNGDVENSSYNLDQAEWTEDHSYYLLQNDLDNQIVRTKEGQVLKLYSENDESTSITKYMDVDALNHSGWYKITLDVKAGSEAFIECLGFRLQADKQIGYYVDEYLFNVDSINQYGWTTLEAKFYIEEQINPAWINLDIWYFNRADLLENQSENNYLLIDNIEVFSAINEIEYIDNLFANGIIEGFSKEQGRTIHDVISVSEFEYSRDLLSRNCWDIFEIGTKLDVCTKDQNYFGTIELDIPAEKVLEENYNAFLLSYDGKQLVKNYSTLTYILHYFDFSVNNTYKISFDYKIENADSNIIRFAFVGLDNYDDYMLNLYEAKIGENLTQGVNKDIYTYIISENGDGWLHAELVFKPNAEFKTRVNSFRFLLSNNFNTENKFYVANLELKEYSDEPLEPLVERVEPVDSKNYLPIIIVSSISIVMLLGTMTCIIIFIKKRKNGEGR